MPCALHSTMMVTSGERDEPKDDNNNNHSSRLPSLTCDTVSSSGSTNATNSTPSRSPSTSPCPPPSSPSSSSSSSTLRNMSSEPVSSTMPPTSTTTNNATSKHSFSIDSLVGGGREESKKTSSPSPSHVEPGPSESMHYQQQQQHHQLIELKRIQAYYQQLYMSSSMLPSIKGEPNYPHLPYAYPKLSPPPSSSILPPPPMSQHEQQQQQQMLAYYANLYLKNSKDIYSETYLKGWKNYVGNGVEAAPGGGGGGDERHWAKEMSAESSSQETNNQTTNTKETSYHELNRMNYSSYYNTSGGHDRSNNAMVVGDMTSGHAKAMFEEHKVAASIYPRLATTGAGYYPQYCDYKTLASKGKHHHGAESDDEMLGAGNQNRSSSNSSSSNSTGHEPGLTSSLHSPLGSNSDAGSLAVAAYHLSNMFRKPKRIRTAFSPGQLLRLEEIFEKNRYVVGCERKQLARDLSLSETQIKVWFQNRRTKHKREKHVGSDHGSDQQSHHHHHHHQQQQQQQASFEANKYLRTMMRNSGYLGGPRSPASPPPPPPQHTSSLSMLSNTSGGHYRFPSNSLVPPSTSGGASLDSSHLRILAK